MEPTQGPHCQMQQQVRPKIPCYHSSTTYLENVILGQRLVAISNSSRNLISNGIRMQPMQQDVYSSEDIFIRIQ